MFISQKRAVHFSATAGAGPREITDTFFFPWPINNLFAGLSGFSASFVGSDSGRPFGRIVVEVGDAGFTGRQATVPIKFGLRDWSGDWDDEYSGVIDYSIHAELVDETEFDENVTINGVEFNQAIQFFRSHLNLESDLRRPDNSIPLVANKATAVRIYADIISPNTSSPDDTHLYDRYEGELEIRSGGQTTIMTEIDDSEGIGGITPRRDTLENPITPDKAPNFIIPAELCQGNVNIRGRVRSVNNGGGESTGWSPRFERDLNFHQRSMPPIFLVGLGFDGELPPTMEEAQSLFRMSLRVLPIPGIDFIGFTQENVPPAAPSSVHQNTIFDILRGIQGDDISGYVYGVFPIDGGPNVVTGSEIAIGGAVPLGETIGFSLGRAGESTVAHEIGHLLGIGHVDTDSGEDSPYQFYPDYGMGEGSIGQHGFDTDTGSDKDPCDFFDMMSYRDPVWIGPPTYTTLFGVFAGLGDGERRLHISKPGSQSTQADVLFLNLEVHRHKNVVRLPSFHFPAERPTRPQIETNICIELADSCRNTIECWPAHYTDEDHCCWPRRIHAKLPFDDRAKWLLVYENDALIYEECIGPPPPLDLICDTQSAGVEVSWSSTPSEEVWYLVQIFDHTGHWRAVGVPGKQESAFIPFGQVTSVRVLASTGISTTIGKCDAVFPVPDDKLSLFIAPAVLQSSSSRRPDKIVGWNISGTTSFGRSNTDGEYLWFDDKGHMINRGPYLAASKLSPDITEVTAMFRGGGATGETTTRRWRVERTNGRPELVEPRKSSYGRKQAPRRNEDRTYPKNGGENL